MIRKTSLVLLFAAAAASCSQPVQQSGYEVAEAQQIAKPAAIQQTTPYVITGNILLPPGTDPAQLVVTVRDTAGNLYTANGISLKRP